MYVIHTLWGEETGIYTADSAELAVCTNPRISHKGADGTRTFDYELVLRLQIARRDEPSGASIAVKITPGNLDDRAPLADMMVGLEGKLLADKGYSVDFR